MPVPDTITNLVDRFGRYGGPINETQTRDGSASLVSTGSNTWIVGAMLKLLFWLYCHLD